jgi:hypothetical protein
MTTQANGHTNGAVAAPTQAGAIVRQGVSSHEMLLQTETASTAMAAQAKAAVEARYAMAVRFPRDFMAVRERILDACKRPMFAQVARYAKPVGGSTIEGWSIRFAEEALRALGNALPETSVIYDDASKRIVRVAVTDLETNLTHTTEVVIQKTVERLHLKSGQVALAQRTNSAGKTTYIVEATEDDLQNKQAALVSKAMRTLALRIIPGDLLEEALVAVKKTLVDGAARDPAAARKALADAFRSIGIRAEQLAEYLGHPLDEATPDEIVDLKQVGQSIKDGETTWREIMEARRPEDAPAAAEAKPATRTDEVKAKLKAQSGEVKAPANAPAEKRATVEIDPETEADWIAGKIAEATTAKEMNEIGGYMEKAKAKLGEHYARLLALYQPKHRAITGIK